LGHRKLATTQQSYGRIVQRKVGEEMRRIREGRKALLLLIRSIKVMISPSYLEKELYWSAYNELFTIKSKNKI